DDAPGGVVVSPSPGPSGARSRNDIVRVATATRTTTARTRGWRRGSGITGGWNARAPADRSLACPADDRCATGAGRLARAGPRSRLWRRDLPLLPLLPGARAGLAPPRRASTATSLGGGAASGRSPAPVGPVAGTSATAASL